MKTALAVLLILVLGVGSAAWADAEGHISGRRLVLTGCVLDLPNDNWGWEEVQAPGPHSVMFRCGRGESQILCMYEACGKMPDSERQKIGQTVLDELQGHFEKMGLVAYKPVMKPTKVPFAQGSLGFKSSVSNMDGRKLKYYGYLGNDQGYVLLLVGLLSNSGDPADFESLAHSCKSFPIPLPTVPPPLSVLGSCLLVAAYIAFVIVTWRMRRMPPDPSELQ